MELCALVALVLSGCGKKHPTDKVTYVDGDDPRMNATIEKARSTVKSFTAILKSPMDGQSGFSIKMALTDGNHTEHMCLIPVSFDGTNFTGNVNNELEGVKSLKMGQKISVAPDEISDWM